MTGTSVLINGTLTELRSAPGSRLSSVLRDELGLTGTKVGCEAGDCGACTVLLDGAAVCACITPLGHCAQKQVTTVEGLARAHSAGASLNRLQQAFLQTGATQCGICTPGMLMAATGLLDRHALAGTVPDRRQVHDAIGGVLCRCTGYQTIVDAILLAAVPASLPAGDLPREAVTPGPCAYVGRSVQRLEGPAKLMGQLKFGADEVPSDALGVLVLRSPFPRARFDLTALRAWCAKHPEIFALVSASDVPFNAFAIFPDLRDQPVFALQETRYRGEAVAALVAEPEVLRALDATALPLAFEALPHVSETDEALASPLAIHANRPDNVLCRGRVVKGEIPSATSAEGLITLTVAATTSYVEHAYIEPEAGYVKLLPAGKPLAQALADKSLRMEVFACTQTPYMDRDEVANILQWDSSRIRIRPSGIGGGFGGKLDLSVQPVLAAVALALAQRGSAHATRAVRLVYDRSESMLATTKRHPARMSAHLYADASGQLIAYDFEGDFNTGAYASWGPTVANRVPIHASGPYRLPNVRALTRAVYTNNAISGAFRGFGVPQATLLIEAALDQLATRLGKDPLELRYDNALQAGDRSATGQVLQTSVGLRQCLDALRPAWKQLRAQAAQFNAQAVLDGSALRRGVGVATMWYGIGNTVIANPSRMRIEVQADGRFLLRNGAQEIGQGSYTIMVQIAADALGVALDQFDQVHGDTDETADAGKSSASRQTFVSGKAVMLAALELRARIAERRSQHGPQANLSGLFGEGHFDPPTIALDQDGQGVPYACYGFAAQIANVEVDTELATVKVLEIHAAHDVGKAINPVFVEGQIHGGIAQGLGLALMEEYVSGRTDNLHDYLIPTVGDMPHIVSYLIEDPEPLGPYGAKGVGEPALVATAPAILGAIEHACGVRPAQLPATPSRLWEALSAARDKDKS